jgi:hypothetical protein
VDRIGSCSVTCSATKLNIHSQTSRGFNKVTKAELAQDYVGGNFEALEEVLIDLGIDPEKDELTVEEARAARNYFRDLEGRAIAPVSDDDVLAVAETSGVDLDVVIRASERLDSLEDLVQWVESYQDLARVHQIKENAKQQFEIDRLEGKEQELAARLSAALKRESPDFEEIRQRLGIEAPEAATRLASWDGKPKGEGEPDFLKSARTALKTQRGMA